MRQRGAEHQRADQETQRLAEIVSIPARRDLHADRIDAGEEEAGGEAREEQERYLTRQKIAATVARRPEQGAGEKRRARRISIRDGKEREHERARNEAELYGARHVAERASRPIEAGLQVGQHRIAGEPEGCAGKL